MNTPVRTAIDVDALTVDALTMGATPLARHSHDVAARRALHLGDPLGAVPAPRAARWAEHTAQRGLDPGRVDPWASLDRSRHRGLAPMDGSVQADIVPAEARVPHHRARTVAER